MIALTTVVIAARSARGSVSSNAESPTSSSFDRLVEVLREQILLLVEEPREEGAFDLVRRRGR